DQLAAPAGGSSNGFGELQNGELLGVAEVDWLAHVGKRQTDQSLDQVAHVAKRARLFTAAEDGEVLSSQRLHHERWYHAPVVESHPRTISIENPCDARGDAAGSVVSGH